MPIQVLNTLSGSKETLSPKNNKIKMYCCGITPYSNTHLGHCRTFFSYDLLYRTLCDHGLEVSWARNVTDVDDKIINKANEEGVTCGDIVSRYVAEQTEMLEAFDLHKPQFEPKVTESIPQIIDIIAKLIERGYAYPSQSGVYYRVRKFAGYGKLSGNKIDDLKKGARIEVDESKEDALDFALWKFAKPNEIFWPSPWGNGRPGWHIECSAMIHSLFGDSIDIHMGGRDLIFPHHEAEIAQSEGLTGKPFSSHWMHTGMMTLYGEKMSKSTNHFVSIKDFLGKYPAEVLRLVFLSASYAQPLDFTFEFATENLKKLSKIYRFVALVDSYVQEEGSGDEFAETVFSGLDTLVARMRCEIENDLNSAGALALFFDFIKGVNTGLGKLEKLGKKLNAQDRAQLDAHWDAFKNWMHRALGLLTVSPAVFFESLKKLGQSSEISAEQIEGKMKERTEARDKKDWAASDAIRQELLNYGIQVQDTPNGPKWTVLI